jgi:hypothetical protein
MKYELTVAVEQLPVSEIWGSHGGDNGSDAVY